MTKTLDTLRTEGYDDLVSPAVAQITEADNMKAFVSTYAEQTSASIADVVIKIKAELKNRDQNTNDRWEPVLEAFAA